MIWSDRPREQAPGGLAWIRRGTGTPVVLIHGVGLRAESMAGLLDDLASDHAVFAPDLPGHGESALPTDAPSLVNYTDPVAGALDAIGAPAIIVGHSLGAMIALDLAFRRPRLCRGVVVLNAIYRRSAAAAAAVRARAEALSSKVTADPEPTLRRWFGDDLDGATARSCRRWLTRVDPRAYKAAYNVFASEDGPADNRLAALSCPALFVTGADEPNSTPAMSQAMAKLAPRGEAVIVPGAAHMMPMTHAAEVNASIRNFLVRHGGARS